MAAGLGEKLVIDGVSRVFSGVRGGAPTRAVEPVRLAVAENDFITILGPSGCGKSTLLRIVAGLDRLIHTRGLTGSIDAGKEDKLAAAVVDARRAIRTALTDEGLADSVEPFDPARYNRHATVADAMAAARAATVVRVQPEMVRAGEGWRMRIPAEADYGGDTFDLVDAAPI